MQLLPDLIINTPGRTIHIAERKHLVSRVEENGSQVLNGSIAERGVQRPSLPLFCDWRRLHEIRITTRRSYLLWLSPSAQNKPRPMRRSRKRFELGVWTYPYVSREKKCWMACRISNNTTSEHFRRSATHLLADWPWGRLKQVPCCPAGVGSRKPNRRRRPIPRRLRRSRVL